MEPNWKIICSFILLFTATLSFGVIYKPLNVTLEGRHLGSNFGITGERGQQYLSATFLRTYCHVATSWNASSGELYFRWGKLNYKLYKDKSYYYLNGKNHLLPASALEKDGQLWIPTEFFTEIGLQVKEKNSKKVSLAWAENYLLAIENTTYQDRPAYLLIGSKKMCIQDCVQKNPDRLVCTLSGMKLHFALDEKMLLSDPLVPEIQLKSDAAGQGVLSFSMRKVAGYRLIPVSGKPEQMILVFNYFLEDISPQADKVNIKTSTPADYTVTSVPRQKRVIIQFHSISGEISNHTIACTNSLAGSIQTYRENENTVKVVVDLATSLRCYVVRSTKDPTLLQIRPISQVNEVQWSKTKGGSVLTISGDGELDETIRVLGREKMLQIDLNHAQFRPGTAVPSPPGNPMTGARLVNVSPVLARMEIDFVNLSSYELENSPNRHQISIYFKDSTLVGKTIVLDAGHGGADTGACGKQDSIEKDINLDVALRLKNLLENAGSKVLMTRDGDYFVGLYERCYFANSHHADMFISIHTNSHPDPSVRGIEVYHFRESNQASKRLATAIIRGIVPTTGFTNLGVKTSNFVVIRETDMPSCLVELGYISNSEEEAMIQTPAFRENAANGIFQGLIDFH